MRVRRRRLGVAVATCALIAMSGCTTSDGSEPTKLPPVSNSGSASSSSAPKLTADQEAIVNQYKAYFDSFIQLGNATKAQVFETLTPFAYPAVVEIAWSGLEALRQQNKQPAGHYSYGSIVPDVTGGTASLSECRDGSTEMLISTIDGSTISQGLPGTSVATKFNKDPDGLWRITELIGKENGC